MFTTASSLNKRARDTQTAMTKAAAEIELIKAHGSLSDYLVAFAEDERLMIAENGGVVTVIIYYDEDWAAVDFENAFYSLTAKILPTDSPALYELSVSVNEIADGETGRTLASLNAKKYFPPADGEGAPL